jgi:hypothetical protein
MYISIYTVYNTFNMMNMQNQSMHPNPAPEEQRVNVVAHGEADME